MAKVFEIERDTERVFGIITVSGRAIWFNTREERDIAYLEMQE